MTHALRFVGVALFAITVAACSTDVDENDAEPITPTAASSTTAPVDQPIRPTSPTITAEPTTDSATAAVTKDPAVSEFSTLADIQRVIAPLGLECGVEDSALFCNRGTDSWQFRISPAGDGDAAFRRSLCQGDPTYNSSGAITDGGNFVVYAGNDGQDVEGFRDQLAGLGVSDLAIERGC